MYTIATITQTCGGCPSQWEGKTTDGKDVYIRFRHGGGRIDIDGETLVEWTDGDGWSGVCDLADVLGYLYGVVELSPEASKEYYGY